jgi:LuxR family transcriptional regulator, maltose regulon positive regulatory protein
MSERRRAKAAPAAIGEAELAAVAPTLFARPALWHDLALAPDARAQAATAPWTAYWAVRLGALDDAAADRAVLSLAWTAFQSSGEPLGALLASAAAIETYYFDETELQPMDAWIERLDAALAALPTWPNDECAAEVMACSAAIRLRQPAHPRLAEWVAAAPRALPRTARGPSRVKYAAAVAHYHLWRGEFGAAAVVFDTLPGADLTLLRPREALVWLEGLAAFARFTAQFERGREAVRQALALVDRHAMATEVYGVNALGAAIELAAHDAAAAQRHLDAMRATLAERSQADQTGYWHLSAGLALLRGDAQAALALARGTLEQSQAVGGAYRSVAHQLSLAGALHAVGHHVASVDAARATMASAHTIDATLTEFSAGLLCSHGLQRLGRHDEADAALAAALHLGAIHDYVITGGWWLPPLVAERLAHALRAGIETDYAARWARRAGLPCPDRTLEAWPWPLVVRGFGELQVVCNGTPLTGTGSRVPQRPLDLLRALLAHGGTALPVTVALDWLWPEADHEQQRKAFDAALLRLRRALGDDSLLVLDGGQLLLDRTRAWTDVAALAEGDWEPKRNGDAATLQAQAERLLRLAPAPLLDGVDTPWAMGARERARRRFVLALGRIAEALEPLAPDPACRLYERALDADPLAESLARRLIQARLARGERAEALRAWHHCKAMLTLHGAAPSADTLAVVRAAALAP